MKSFSHPEINYAVCVLFFLSLGSGLEVNCTESILRALAVSFSPSYIPTSRAMASLFRTISTPPYTSLKLPTLRIPPAIIMLKLRSERRLFCTFTKQ